MALGYSPPRTLPSRPLPRRSALTFSLIRDSYRVFFRERRTLFLRLPCDQGHELRVSAMLQHLLETGHRLPAAPPRPRRLGEDLPLERIQIRPAIQPLPECREAPRRPEGQALPAQLRPRRLLGAAGKRPTSSGSTCRRLPSLPPVETLRCQDAQSENGRPGYHPNRPRRLDRLTFASQPGPLARPHDDGQKTRGAPRRKGNSCGTSCPTSTRCRRGSRRWASESERGVLAT